MLPKKPIFVFFLILTSVSFVRLFKFLWHSSQPAASPQVTATTEENLRHKTEPPVESILSPKELRLLSNAISKRVPCNLLIFGFNPQFLPLAAMNREGATLFLEDDPEKVRIARSKGLKIYHFDNHEKASRAYELLRRARSEPACASISGSGCELALKGLPKEVERTKWDAVIVDGPSGDRPEAAGRMGAIYTAAALGAGGADVLVHDTDRTIEKWYAWELLCHENLIASKGKLWHFRIKINASCDSFCCVSVV